MPYQTINHHRYYYEIEGEGPPLLLIAGYTSDISFWTPVRALLAKHFRLLLFDNSSIGRSDYRKSLKLEQMAEESLDLAESLGLMRPHVLGQSMGGAIAQIMALHYPERINRVIFSQSFLKLPPAGSTMMKTVLHLYAAGVSARLRAEVTMPWLFSDAFLQNSKKVSTLLNSYEKHPHPPTLEGLESQLHALLQFDSTTWYHLIKKEPLIFCGDQDRLCSSQDSLLMSQNIAGARLHVFEHTGHLAPLEHPKEFCQEVIGYL